ncbi:MAG: ABC transporter ATP-binding protein [Bacteroidales bacterium]|nr:ABC transporter ATP-binding protein [Bacteroidales bacterium]
MMGNSKLLELTDLCVSFKQKDDYRQVLKGVNYTLYRGKTLGIVGESGSGKSVSSLALMGLLPKNAKVSGHAWFSTPSDPSDKSTPSDSGHRSQVTDHTSPIDLLSLSEDEFRHYRGDHIAMIFQEPMTSLNPVHKCGAQVVEMLLQHEKVSHKEARERVIELFKEVLLPRPEKIFDSYPHEISGGQKQRVMIAMALVCNPSILIADEPTTALDVTVQKTILELLRDLQKKHNLAIIFITHDLGVIAQIADDIAVMYHGEIVEQGDTQQILHNPQHPYTKGLLACRPPLDSRPERLPTVKDFLSSSEQPAVSNQPTDIHNSKFKIQNSTATPLLKVRDWNVTYPLKKTIFGKVTQELKAVDNITFDIYRGETLGLVGESGCGKTTLGRSLLQLIEHSSGTVVYDGKPLDKLSSKELRHLRTKMQIVFQDPYSSLNPRLTIGDAILEPLRSHHIYDTDSERREAVNTLLEEVGLDRSVYGRYPHEFSGGQRQRVCIARALIVKPELVICDESVSALDVSVQAQVLNLLNDLKRKYGYTYLFITHDLSVVKFFSDRIMVMEKGRMVELNDADELYAHPQQEYTKRLIDAIPRI